MGPESGTIDVAQEVSWHRCFVAPTPEQDRAGRGYLAFLRDQLGCTGVTAVHTARRYDVKTTIDQFEDGKYSAISAAPVEDVLTEDQFYTAHAGCTELSTKSPANQINTLDKNVGLSFQMRFGGNPPPVRTAEIIMIEGDITPEQFQSFQAFYVNPVERVIASRAPAAEQKEPEIPSVVTMTEGLCASSPGELAQWKKKYDVRIHDENLLRVQEEFKMYENGRDPTLAEMRVIEARWSDHCCHSTFLQMLTEVSMGGQVVYQEGKLIEGMTMPTPYEQVMYDTFVQYVKDRQRVLGEAAETEPLSLMDLATFTKKEAEYDGRLTQIEIDAKENNAAVLRVGENLIGFKVETHNHPTTIGPRGGSETDLGGVIRDLKGMRLFPIGGWRLTARGDPRRSVTDRLGDQLHPRYLTQEAAGGYSSYGNAGGFPTNRVEEHYFDDRKGGVTFDAKTFECGFAIGAAPISHIAWRDPVPGDKIILYGGDTGRDGIGGASGSSSEMKKDSVHTAKGEVQMGDPLNEQAFMEMSFCKAMSLMEVKVNDDGAGGLATSNGELADSGVRINLDLVPLRSPDLKAEEILLSESQERMSPVVSAENEQAYIQGADAHNVPATCIGEITDTGRFEVSWKDQSVCNLRTAFLNSGWVRGKKSVNVLSYGNPQDYFTAYPAEVPADASLQQQWESNTASLAHAGQRGLGAMFDGTVRGRTITSGYSGKYQASPLSAIAAYASEDGADGLGVVAASGWDPQLMNDFPFVGAAYDVCTAVMRILSTGGDKETVRLALQNYFEGPGNVPERWGNMFQGQLGARFAQKITKAIATNGKDSSSGAADIDGARYRVPHTIAAFAISPIEVVRLVQSCLQEAGNHLVHIDFHRDAAGMPDPDAFAAVIERIDQLITEGKIRSSSVVQNGGIARALTEMSFGNRIGADLMNYASGDNQQWFAPLLASLVLEVPGSEDISSLFAGLQYTVLGKTKADPTLSVEGDDGFHLDIQALQKISDATLNDTFPVEAPSIDTVTYSEELPSNFRYAKPSDLKTVTHPFAVLPRFPGGNSHRETGRLLKQAGAHISVPVFRNLTPKMQEESLQQLADEIRTAQMLVLSGGFTFRDQPVTGRGMALALRNNRVADALEEARDKNGLMILGICNGFQSLVDAGMFPDGKMHTLRKDDPILTANSINRFHTQKVDMRVRGNTSPWFQKFSDGETVSGILAAGQANLVASPSTIQMLRTKGSIAAQYIGNDGLIADDFLHNPPGSTESIAGLVSEDGSVTGLMPHLERFDKGRLLNIPGYRASEKFFQGGVDHFR